MEAWAIVRLQATCASPTVPQRRHTLRCALALALSVAVWGEARGGGPLEPVLAGWPGIETRLKVTAEMLDTHWTSLVRAPDSAPDYSLAAPAAGARWSPLRRSSDLIEFAPVRPGNGDAQAYVRPQFALGLPSDSLRGWLRNAGVDASACTAPLMKMHSAFAGSSAHAKVSLSARCSIH